MFSFFVGAGNVLDFLGDLCPSTIGTTNPYFSDMIEMFRASPMQSIDSYLCDKYV